MMPCKNKSAASMTKMNGNTHTTINIHPHVCSVAEEKSGEKTVLDGRWQRQIEQVELFPLQ